MQIILSPAKTIDINASCPQGMESLPDFNDEATVLMSKLKILNQTELIAAETVSPHISRLCPTEIDIKELQQFQLPKKGFAVSDVAQAQGCI